MSDPTDRKRNTPRVESFEGFLSILGYKEEGEWVALALEMDLRGYGETWEAALYELYELVIMQVEFAIGRSEHQMIWRDAEPEYWERFRHTQRANLLEQTATSEFHATGLVLPPAHVIASRRSRYAVADG
jgi:hypothetical protein